MRETIGLFPAIAIWATVVLAVCPLGIGLGRLVAYIRKRMFYSRLSKLAGIPLKDWRKIDVSVLYAIDSNCSLAQDSIYHYWSDCYSSIYKVAVLRLTEIASDGEVLRKKYFLVTTDGTKQLHDWRLIDIRDRHERIVAWLEDPLERRTAIYGEEDGTVNDLLSKIVKSIDQYENTADAWMKQFIPWATELLEIMRHAVPHSPLLAELAKVIADGPYAHLTGLELELPNPKTIKARSRQRGSKPAETGSAA